MITKFLNFVSCCKLRDAIHHKLAKSSFIQALQSESVFFNRTCVFRIQLRIGIESFFFIFWESESEPESFLEKLRIGIVFFYFLRIRIGIGIVFFENWESDSESHLENIDGFILISEAVIFWTKNISFEKNLSTKIRR